MCVLHGIYFPCLKLHQPRPTWLYERDMNDFGRGVIKKKFCILIWQCGHINFCTKSHENSWSLVPYHIFRQQSSLGDCVTNRIHGRRKSLNVNKLGKIILKCSFRPHGDLAAEGLDCEIYQYWLIQRKSLQLANNCLTKMQFVQRSLHTVCTASHDDVIKWKHFPRYWPFVRGIHRSPVNSPQKGQCRGALMFLSSAPWINVWVNNRAAGDLRRHRTHYDVIVMLFCAWVIILSLDFKDYFIVKIIIRFSMFQ